MDFFQDSIGGWSGYRICAGDVSLGIVPDVGGRIMSLAFRGEELLYQHPSEAGQTYDFSRETDLLSFKTGFGFRIFGGDKTWVAPERAWAGKIPPLELDAGPYALRLEGHTAVMTSPVCRETGLQILRSLSIDPHGDVFLKEEFFNTASSEITRGIWNVTQIRKPFAVYVPARPGDVRSYHEEDETLPRPGLEPVVRGQGVLIPCEGTTYYKFGAMIRRGQAVVVKDTLQGRVCWERSFGIDLQQPYAHRSVVEVFNSAPYDYGELEIHSPLYRITPGMRVSLSQHWRLFMGEGDFS